MKALSIRQPWAWLIVRPDIVDQDERAAARLDHRIKPVENRTWDTHYRGPLLIHAGLGMTRADYDACWIFLSSDESLWPLTGKLPPAEGLQRGGIVGVANLVACVRAHESPFFCGPVGLLLMDTKPLPFISMKGALGLFDVPTIQHA